MPNLKLHIVQKLNNISTHRELVEITKTDFTDAFIVLTSEMSVTT